MIRERTRELVELSSTNERGSGAINTLPHDRTVRSCPMPQSTPLERFLVKVDRQSSGCWQWLAAMDKGYGKFWSGERLMSAHRWAYEHWVGPIPDGFHVHHRCGNPSCVNPAHLEPMSHGDHNRITDNVTTRHGRQTHCIRGHEFTPENTWIRPDRVARQCRTCMRERCRRQYWKRKRAA